MTAGFSARLLGTCAAAALTLAGCGSKSDLDQAAANQATKQNAAVPTVAAPNNQDWTLVVQETPDGGFRMGNPEAPVKLIEYASITCPHCAEFSNEGAQQLRERYVRSGQVSWEYRPVIIFPTDPSVFMLLKCNGPQPFFRTVEQLYATQRDWFGKVQQQAETLNALPVQQRVSGIIRAGELDQFFRQRGMPSARVDSCLADQNALQQFLTQSQDRSQRDGVTGTPTFFINGEKQEAVGYWNQPGNPDQSLEPKLRAAIG
jgi:protein-disulfide isomerase